MPVQNAKARWADLTIAQAAAAARDIMAQVKEGSPHPLWIPGLESYLRAGLHAATLLVSALEIVERRMKREA
jgi:hypothetical protein